MTVADDNMRLCIHAANDVAWMQGLLACQCDFKTKEAWFFPVRKNIGITIPKDGQGFALLNIMGNFASH